MADKAKKQESFLNAYGKPFIIGSLSGSIASAVIQPIDTIKVVIQARREAAGKGTAVVNPFQVGRDIVTQNGVAGLYKGVDSAIMRQFIYCGIRLGLYKSLEDQKKAKEGRNLKFMEKVAYSLFSGAVGSAIATPTDVALIRFQSDNNLPPEQRRNYKNVFDALATIRREEGIKGLWTGAIPTIARAMSLNCSHLVAYNESKEALLGPLGGGKETMSLRLVASAISGVAVAIISLPFDNVKTKIMKMKPGT
jgi:solute carrier family 25 oxoglutarate transporter 11